MTFTKKARNVYFVKPVGLDGPIKIGCSDVPASRVINLAAWSPFPLELIGSVSGTLVDESYLHQCFADIHSHREWFRSTPGLRAAINQVLAAGTVDVLRSTHAPKGSIRSGNNSKRTPAWRKYFSYEARVRGAEKRLRNKDKDGAYHAPQDVRDIIHRWYRRPGNSILAADLVRLDEYLANPAAHSIIPEWRKPRLISLVAEAAKHAGFVAADHHKAVQS